MAMCLWASGGCSASMATVQPARTTPEGHWQAVAAVSVTPPTALPGESLEAVRTLDDDISGRANEAELQRIGEVTTTAIVQPPSADGQLAVSYGVSQRFELGARVGPTAAGAGFRIQWLRRSPGIYGVLGARAMIGFNDYPVERFTDEVRIERFRRYDFAFPLHLGYSGRVVHLWAGPQLMISRFSTDVGICLDDECRQEAMVTASGRATYLTGQVGIALGRRRFWVALELSVSRVNIIADLDLTMDGTRYLGGQRQSGRVLTPSLGLIAWF